MGTLKRSKLWNACELTRFYQYANGEEQHTFNNVLRVSPWKKLDGTPIESIPCYTEAYPTEYPSALAVSNIYLSVSHSFDSFTIPHLTEDLLSNWTDDEYLINESIPSTYYTLKVSDNSQTAIKYYIDAENTTNNQISITCIKFSKYVGNRGLYAAYYLDSPIVFNPGDRKTIEVIITPDMLYSDNIYIKKSAGWYAYEGVRFGTISKYLYNRYDPDTETFGPGPNIPGKDLSSANINDTSNLTRSVWPCLGFQHRNMDVILTDEPLSSYNQQTHDSVWPYSDNFQYNVLKNNDTYSWRGFLDSELIYNYDPVRVWYEFVGVCFKIFAYNDNSEDFTLRCLRFVRDGYGIHYDKRYPGFNDNYITPYDPKPIIFGYEGVVPYMTYYLPVPIVIPHNEGRLVEIHVSPKGISVS